MSTPSTEERIKEIEMRHVCGGDGCSICWLICSFRGAVGELAVCEHDADLLIAELRAGLARCDNQALIISEDKVYLASVTAQRDAALADNTRLRGALDGFVNCSTWDQHHAAVTQARAALTPSPREETNG